MIRAVPDRAARQRTIVGLALSLGLALAAAGLAQFWLETRGAAAPVAVVRTAEVLVTARAIEPGSVLTAADLRWQAWPVSAIDPSWQVRGRGALAMAGRVAPARLAAGSPLTAAMAVAPGAGSAFAAAIRPGWRAVTIAVSPAAGLAGFVAPGDRVDVMLIQAIGNRRTGAVLMADITVLGVDQTPRGHGGAAAALAAASDVVAEANAESGAAPPDLVTLEVTPAQAEHLAVAADMGKLSLALRGPGQEIAGARGRSWDTDITGLSVAALGAGDAPRAVPPPALPAAAVLAAAPLAQAPPQAAPRPGGVEIVYGLQPASAVAK